MTKFKRLMALAAVSMLGIQLMGVGTAFAAGESDCDFGSDNLEVTIDMDDVALWVDSDGLLWCDPDMGGGPSEVSQAVSTIDSITVEMDDVEDSTGHLTIYLDDEDTNAAEWPDFDTFDIDVTTRLYVDGSGVDDGAANKLKVTFGKGTFSFLGTSGTYAAPSLEFADGEDDDVFDASKATVRVYVNDDLTGDLMGDDTYKGGSGNDKIDLSGYTDSDDSLVVYGNAGNDLIKGGAGDDQGWGGDGSDTIDLGSEDSADVAAPGAGDDDVTGAEIVTYADLSGGMTWSNGALTAISTGGAAGDDDFGDDGDEDVVILEGTSGDDVISDSDALAEVYGLGGDDVIRVGVDAAYVEGGAGNDLIIDKGTVADSDNEFYGNAGNDVLRGKGGDDILRGGPGSDQAWGGTGEDTCGGEVTNRCELFARR